MKLRDLKARSGLIALRVSIFITASFLIIFLTLLFFKGSKVINLAFFTQSPKMGMTKGGIFPAIIGTLYLTVLSIAIAFPIGLLGAIYLHEYAKPAWLVKIIQTAINTLSGVPSIVFGLFGMAIFVIMFKFGVSILAGGCTLGILILPVIINASEQALRNIPKEFREAAYGLGATKRQVIMNIVLPAALPNILTGVIISVGRAAGETAPILFTAATYYTRRLPKSVFSEVMALPYHIYALMTEGTAPEFQEPIAYGTALVLLMLVLTVNLIAILIRYKIRKERNW